MGFVKHTNHVHRWGTARDLDLWYAAINAAIDRKRHEQESGHHNEHAPTADMPALRSTGT